MAKEYGEFECKICGAVFFKKKSYDCHKGIHVRESSGPPKCKGKNCGVILTDKNWHESMKKLGNRLCKKCTKLRNKESYKRKKNRIGGK